MKDVLSITNQQIRELRLTFADKLKEIRRFPDDVQKKIYAKFYGATQFDMEAERRFSAIMPWVEQWVEVQVPSMVQREVFAKSKESLQTLLEQNKKQMLNGFKELLSSRIIEPMFRVDELLQSLTDEIELVSFACNILTQ
jgi:hypothetical protein